MTKGWLIAVMVQTPGERAPVRHFFAVGLVDRAQAEWRAIDSALGLGQVATSPVSGLEPVHMVCEVAPRTIHNLALKNGEVRHLGCRWPRRWIAPQAPSQDPAKGDPAHH